MVRFAGASTRASVLRHLATHPPPESVVDPSSGLNDGAVRALGGGGLRGLLAANEAVTGTLGLAQVLTQVVRSARDLLGCVDAALEVLDAEGGAARFVLLGAEDGQSGASAGPAWRPANDVSTPFCLVVPIRLRDQAIATLFVAGTPDGVPFGGEDETLLVAFATTAAVAIEHARQLAESARRQRWLQATARITTALLSEADSPAVLRSVMAEGRLLVDADDVLVTRPMDDREETLHALAAVGDDTGRWAAATVPLSGTVTLLACQIGLVVSADLSTDERFPQARTRHPGVGALIAMPLAVAGRIIAVLVVTRDQGQPPFSAEQQDTIAAFSEHVALAVERARARTDLERVRLVSERDRIARDVHDHVIGRLVGSGMAVQGLARWISDEAGQRRLATHIDELDEVIRDLRTLIYGLDRDPQEVWTLPSRVRQVVDEAALHLGFVPTLHIDQQLELGPGTAVPGHVLAVLREALANVARHANARAVQVTLVAGDTVDLTVADDGTGLPAQRVIPTVSGGHGLHNMVERARALGGTCRLVSNPSGGTTVRWSAPNPR